MVQSEFCACPTLRFFAFCGCENFQNHAGFDVGDGFDSHRPAPVFVVGRDEPSRRVSCPASAGRPDILTAGERYRSGQTGQTVNLLAYAFDGSNPSLSTTHARKGLRSPAVYALEHARRANIPARIPGRRLAGRCPEASGLCRIGREKPSYCAQDAPQCAGV